VTKKTICTICKTAPRDPLLKDAHCRQCNRKRSRDMRREERGTKNFRASLDDQGTRPHPLGTCHDCGGEVYANGRCREHLLAYQRAWMAKNRPPKKEKPPKVCKVCGEPRHERAYSRAALCERHFKEERRITMSELQAKKRNAGRYQRPPAPIPDKPIIIGPAAIEVVKPVDVRGFKVTRALLPAGWGR
jgi:hypothetical protein